MAIARRCRCAGERALGSPPELWLEALPLYGELQRGEAIHTLEHVARHVPDLRVATMPARYEDLVRCELPLTNEEIARLRSFPPSLHGCVPNSLPMPYQNRFSTTTSIRTTSSNASGTCASSTGVTRPSPTPSLRWSSPSASSRRRTGSHPTIPGSTGSVTPIWSRGALAWWRPSRSPCASGRLLTRSHGPGSGTTYPKTSANLSISGSRPSFGAHSPSCQTDANPYSLS